MTYICITKEGYNFDDPGTNLLTGHLLTSTLTRLKEARRNFLKNRQPGLERSINNCLSNNKIQSDVSRACGCAQTSETQGDATRRARLCGQAERVLDCGSPLCPTHPPIAAARNAPLAPAGSACDESGAASMMGRPPG